MKIVHVLKPSRRRRPSRKFLSRKKRSHFVKDLKGGFLPALIPLIAAAITAAPAIASTVITAQNARRS